MQTTRAYADMSTEELWAERRRLAALANPAMMGRYLDPTHFHARAHTKLIGKTLACLGPHAIERLLITTPPQVGKSRLASELFPFWWLAKKPRDRVLVGSYAASLAVKKSRAVRELVRAHGHKFEMRLQPGDQSSDDWSLTTGGGMRAAGVGGGLTGHTGNVALVDDPHKDRKEAESAVFRDAVWDWWSSAVLSRLSPHAPAVLILCVVASMRVLTGEGRWVAIESIKPGDTVVSLGEDRISLRTAKVIGQRFSGYDTSYTVRTDRLELKVNGAHPFAVLARNRAHPSSRNIEWVRADELKPGDRVVTAKSLPDDYQPDDTLPDGREVTPQLAWLLGFLLGDGWVTAHRRRNQAGQPTSYAVCCAQGNSSQEAKAGLENRVYEAFTAFSPNRVYETKFRYWRTDWNDGGRLLQRMGYGAGARNKRVPECVWRWSPELRREFIAGYAMADGTKQKQNRSRAWRLVSVNRELLHDIRDLALTCGVRPTRVFTDKERTYQPPNSPESIRSVLHSLGVAFLPGEPEGKTHLADRRHFAPRHLRYERVREVTRGPELPVYDLAVEGTETFIAEGFAVHNTRWHERDLAGRLLAREGRASEGGKWHVLHLPAFATSPDDPLGRAVGDPLTHPKIVDADTDALRAHWETKRSGSTVRDWSALYQGDPKPREGALLSAAQVEAQRYFLHVVEPVRRAVAVDPSGGGKDETGIIAGFLGADQRVYITHDRSGVMPSTEWARRVCILAYETDAQVIYVEKNYGGDLSLIPISGAWDKLQREGVIDKSALKPWIEPKTAKSGKILRAEPIAQAWIEDRVRTWALMPELEDEWETYQAGVPDSPGRLDASVYLVYGLLQLPGSDQHIGNAAPVSIEAAADRAQQAPSGGLGSISLGR